MSHVLIVEDEAHLANGLRFNLEAEGHAVTVVRDGESALSLLLGDLRSGGGDREILRAVRRPQRWQHPGQNEQDVAARSHAQGLLNRRGELRGRSWRTPV